jgi:hypothetical protein
MIPLRHLDKPSMFPPPFLTAMVLSLPPRMLLHTTAVALPAIWVAGGSPTLYVRSQPKRQPRHSSKTRLLRRSFFQQLCHIQDQLKLLDLFHESDGGPSPYDPIRVRQSLIGRSTPALYPFTGDIHTFTPWRPASPPDPYIPDHNEDCPQDDSLSTMSTAALANASSMQSSNSFSNSEERERSKDRLLDLKIAPLPTSGKALREWVLSLKWSLTSDCWCHDGVHTTDLTITTPGRKLLSNDLLAVLKKAVTTHTSTSHQRNAHSLLQDNINGVDGMELIAVRNVSPPIKSGFSRGLGT